MMLTPFQISRWFWMFLMPFCVSCNSLFYAPSPQIFTTPDQFGLQYEWVTFQSADGTSLSGWFLPAAAPATSAHGTIIQLHGNGENMTTHYLSLAWLVLEGYNLFAFDYRGYGKSEGEPNLHGPVQDAIAALEYIRTRPDVNPHKLFVHGQSLGGALAVAALAKSPRDGVQALILENAFASYQQIAREKLALSWLTWWLQPLAWGLVRDTYSPEELLPQLGSLPILIIHGTEDSIVPYHHSDQLYAAALGPKKRWEVLGGQHVDTFMRFGKQYRPQLLEFLAHPQSLADR